MGGRGSGSERGGGGGSLNTSGMQGTEKQVSWATDILNRYISEFDKAVDDIKTDIRYGTNKEYTELAKRTIKQVTSQKNKEISAFNAGIKEKGLKATDVINRRMAFSADASKITQGVMRRNGVTDAIKIGHFTLHIRKK